MSTPDFKFIILSRFCGQFQVAEENMCNVRKTSEDIVMDLRPMAEFTTNEISEHLALNGYKIGFDDSTPVWLMRTAPTNELGE